MATLNLDDYVPTITDKNGLPVQDMPAFALASTVELIDDNSGFLNQIDQNVKHSPGVMAWNVYSNEAMWWLICLANNIVDPIHETAEGKLILVPTTATARNMLNQSSDFATEDSIDSIIDQNKGEVIELN